MILAEIRAKIVWRPAVFALAALAALAGGGIRAQRNASSLARSASDGWLALVDSSKYGESWDTASSDFKLVISREKWLDQMRAARAPLGRALSRSAVKSDYLKDPQGAPRGEYIAIRYDTSFENRASAVELVIPKLEADGKWRVSNYVIRNGE